MLFTRESDYAIRIVRALKDGEKYRVKEICISENIPEAFAYKILKKMQKSGIVQAVRGAQGGYMLTKTPGELTLYDIITAIEPDFSVTPCMNHYCSKNTKDQPCNIHKELSGIQRSIIHELNSKTMEQVFGE